MLRVPCAVQQVGLIICFIYSRAYMLIPDGSSKKNLPANAGDTGGEGLIPGSGRSPMEGNGNSLQFSFLENPMDRGTWWATVHGSQSVGQDCRDLAHTQPDSNCGLLEGVKVN